MPQVKTVSVKYGTKRNLGDFNSVNFEISVWADVEEDEDLDDVMKALWEMAKENVRAQATRVVSRQKVETEEIFLGLPIEVQDSIKEEDSIKGEEAINGNHRTD